MMFVTKKIGYKVLKLLRGYAPILCNYGKQKDGYKAYYEQQQFHRSV